jgi:hypothetical protein
VRSVARGSCWLALRRKIASAGESPFEKRGSAPTAPPGTTSDSGPGHWRSKFSFCQKATVASCSPVVESARDKQARGAPALSTEQVPAPVRAPLSVGRNRITLPLWSALFRSATKAATSKPTSLTVAPGVNRQRRRPSPRPAPLHHWHAGRVALGTLLRGMGAGPSGRPQADRSPTAGEAPRRRGLARARRRRLRRPASGRRACPQPNDQRTRFCRRCRSGRGPCLAGPGTLIGVDEEAIDCVTIGFIRKAAAEDHVLEQRGSLV